MKWFKSAEDLVANQTQELERRALEKAAETRDWNEFRGSPMSGFGWGIRTEGEWTVGTDTVYQLSHLPSVLVHRDLRFQED